METIPAALAAWTLAAAALGIQTAVELVDSILTPLFFSDPADTGTAQVKKAVLKVLSLVFCGAMAWNLNLNAIHDFGEWGRWVTVLTLAGAAEVLNSLLKFVNYAKENQKNQAATSLKTAAAPPRPLATTASR